MDHGPAALAGGVLGAASTFAARLRRAKPLHPRGVVLPGRLRRPGGGRTGVAWFDTAGEDDVVVRLSRSGGVPSPGPDVMGLALRYVDRDAGRVDVLLASTGLAPGLRHVLAPHRGIGRGAFTSLLPFAGPAGPVLLAAVPDPPRDLPTDLGRAADVLRQEPWRLRLGWAGLRGRWHPWGVLEVGGHGVVAGASTGSPGAAAGEDPPLRFDPLLTPPGLATYPWVVRLREPAYAAARRAWAARAAPPRAPGRTAARRARAGTRRDPITAATRRPA